MMAARQGVMKASYKTDSLLCKMGDLHKQLTGLQESMNRVEILVQRLVNHQARVVEPRNIPDRAQLGKLEMARGVDDLRQINVRSTPEGNFNFPSTGFSVVATGWDQDPLPHPTIAFPDPDSSNDRAHNSYKSLTKGPKLDSPEFDGGEPLVEAAVQKKETTMKPCTPGVCKYCGYKWFFGHKCTQYQQVNLIASEVIDGLDCAVLSMKKGEVALVTIPLEYAIGFTELRQDLAVVPTNSTFIHEVELVSFVKDKESVYALAMKDIRTLLVSGGTESVVRVWDPGTGSKNMKMRHEVEEERNMLQMSKVWQQRLFKEPEEKQLSVSGHYWGRIEINGNMLSFNVVTKEAFEVSLADVSHMDFKSIGANEKGSLMDLSFHVQTSNTQFVGHEHRPPAQILWQTILSKADVGSSKMVVVIFDGIAILRPRELAKQVEDITKVQTLLFSANIPAWVKKLSLKFLKDNKKTVDLVGDKKLKASASVKHLALSCSSVARAQIISDITRCYSHGGRTIIFTETKESATELSGLIAGSRALHGDVVQAQREVILVGFGSGKFLVLVATNVAVLGLDIDDVQLITQCEPPRDVEAYIHWLGRTGRAGNTGVAVMLLKLRYKHNVSRIERESGVKFEHISAPLPTDLAQSAGTEVAEAIANLSSQYFELLVKLKNDQEHLFRNMPRNEYHNLFNFMIGKYLKILNLEMGTKDMDFVQLLVSLQNSRFSNRWIWSCRGKNWCVAERLGKMYPGGIDRFKKAQTMEPFSVHSGLDAKNAPVVVRTGKSPLAPWTLPQNSHFGPSQNNQISGHVGTQVGSGQSTWQPPDWVIEPHPGVYYLDVLKDGEVIDRINLDMKRHIFGRQVPVLRFCVGPSVCVMPACCHHSTQKWKHLCYGFRISSRHVCGK